jgi:hypothetical protein
MMSPSPVISPHKATRWAFSTGNGLLRCECMKECAKPGKSGGRSLDLKDASSRSQLLNDLWVLLCAQALPLPLTLVGLGLWSWGYSTLPLLVLTGLNGGLVAIRFALLFAIAPSYDGRRPRLHLGCFGYLLLPILSPFSAFSSRRALNRNLGEDAVINELLLVVCYWLLVTLQKLNFAFSG